MNPICRICNDTHVMVLECRDVLCTSCPIPCNDCRLGGTGPYCTHTPCSCACHADHWAYRDRAPISTPDLDKRAELNAVAAEVMKFRPVVGTGSQKRYYVLNGNTISDWNPCGNPEHTKKLMAPYEDWTLRKIGRQKDPNLKFEVIIDVLRQPVMYGSGSGPTAEYAMTQAIVNLWKCKQKMIQEGLIRAE